MASISVHKLRKRRVFKAAPFTKFTMLITVSMYHAMNSHNVWIVLLSSLASFKNPEREPSIAGSPSVQIPTTFFQLKPSVVKKSDTTFKTSCAVVSLVSPRQNKKSSKILPS